MEKDYNTMKKRRKGKARTKYPTRVIEGSSQRDYEEMKNETYCPITSCDSFLNIPGQFILFLKTTFLIY